MCAAEKGNRQAPGGSTQSERGKLGRADSAAQRAELLREAEEYMQELRWQLVLRRLIMCLPACRNLFCLRF